MSLYVQWARDVIEAYVKNRVVIDSEAYKENEFFLKKRACFVSIHLKDGSLRGCIGTIFPCEDSLYEEIRSNAINASTRDPRFPSIDLSELENLEINVDVLSDIKRVEDINMLDAKKYGVIVEKNGRKGLLLPNLDGVDTVEKQLDIAKQKAGLGRYANSQLEISCFTVDRYY